MVRVAVTPPPPLHPQLLKELYSLMVLLRVGWGFRSATVIPSGGKRIRKREGGGKWGKGDWSGEGGGDEGGVDV